MARSDSGSGPDSQSVAEAFVNTWVSRFGVPRIIITDRGTQFESALWWYIMQRLGIERRRTTAYNPACNGAIECCHRTLKTALRAVCKVNQWHTALPLVLLGLRTTIKKSGHTPAQLVYGTQLAIPGQLFAPPTKAQSPTDDFASGLSIAMSNLTAPRREFQRLGHIPKDLPKATHVWVRNPAPKSFLSHRYLGPYRVTDRSDHTITIDKNGEQDIISMDRVKPAHIEPQSDPADVTASNNSSHSSLAAPQETPPANPASILAAPQLTEEDEYQSGRIVMAKYPGHPAWPAQIVDASSTPLAGRRATADSVAVQFFSTNRYAFVPRKNVNAFDSSRCDSQHRGVLRAHRLASQALASSAEATCTATEKPRGRRVTCAPHPEVRFIPRR